MSTASMALTGRKMRALVHTGGGSALPVQLREIDVPAVSAGRVLVRVRAASVNAGDWHRVHGGRLVAAIGWLLRVPSQPIIGGDLAGIVEAVGEGVERFKPGDEVFGAGLGSIAEYSLAKEDRLAPKPPELSFDEAAAIPIAGATALHGLRDTGRLQPGQRVLVYGAGGGVGTFAVQVAKALGAEVTAVTSTQNLEMVRPLKPLELIDYTQEDVTRRGRSYDLIFDVAATCRLADLTRVLEPGGTLVLAGAAKGGVLAIAARLLGAQVRSRLGGQRVHSFLARVNSDNLQVLAGFASAGKLKPVIDRRYLLAEAEEAIRYVGTGRARGKVVIGIG